MISLQLDEKYTIVITERSDGDMRDRSLYPELLRPEKQDHGTLIHTIDEGHLSIPFSHVDGVYTELPGVTIGCLTADCPIVVVMGRGEIMTLHSGWRGTRAKIVDRIAEYFTTPLSEVDIWIGPHIRDYEVGVEFEQYFDHRYLEKKGDRYRLSLEQKIINDLIDLGIHEDHITSHGADTYHDSRLHSYRRDGDAGIGFIGIMQR